MRFIFFRLLKAVPFYEKIIRVISQHYFVSLLSNLIKFFFMVAHCDAVITDLRWIKQTTNS